LTDRKPQKKQKLADIYKMSQQLDIHKIRSTKQPNTMQDMIYPSPISKKHFPTLVSIEEESSQNLTGQNNSLAATIKDTKGTVTGHNMKANKRTRANIVKDTDEVNSQSAREKQDVTAKENAGTVTARAAVVAKKRRNEDRLMTVPAQMNDSDYSSQDKLQEKPKTIENYQEDRPTGAYAKSRNFRAGSNLTNIDDSSRISRNHSQLVVSTLPLLAESSFLKKSKIYGRS